MPKEMRVVQVPAPKAPFEIVERDIPEPQSAMVRIKVQACGVCHSDVVTKDGLFPFNSVSAGSGARGGRTDRRGEPGRSADGKWASRVGVGWNGGYCGYCDSCRRGNFFACQTATQIDRASPVTADTPTT